jgi:hypothetical protein
MKGAVWKELAGLMRPSDRVFDTPVSQGRMRPEMNALHIAYDFVQLSKH